MSGWDTALGDRRAIELCGRKAGAQEGEIRRWRMGGSKDRRVNKNNWDN